MCSDESQRCLSRTHRSPEYYKWPLGPEFEQALQVSACTEQEADTDSCVGVGVGVGVCIICLHGSCTTDAARWHEFTVMEGRTPASVPMRPDR